MELTPQELKEISDLTLDHYDQRAHGFWEGTRGRDVSQNISAMLQFVKGEPPFTVLDFGCGPGRELKAFADLGHSAIGLEGSERFAEMARTYSLRGGQQNFLSLDLPLSKFDGVFANAALSHVPCQELSRVLQELRVCLEPGGVLFSSNPRAKMTRAGAANATGFFTN